MIMGKKTRFSKQRCFQKESFKEIIEDIEHTKALESLPRIRKEVPNGKETLEEILHDDDRKQ